MIRGGSGRLRLWMTSWLVVLAGACGSAGAGQTHVWVDRSGRSRIAAEFVRLHNGVVTLRRANGKLYNVPLSKFNGASQALAKALAASQAARGPGDPPQPVPPAGRPRPRTPAKSPLAALPAANAPAAIVVKAPVRIDVPARGATTITFACGKGPYVAVDAKVYEITTGRAVGKTVLPPGTVHASNRALSPDGTWYALCRWAGKTSVIDLARTGTEGAKTVPMAPDQMALTTWLGFSSNTQLVWLGHMGGAMRVIAFDVQEGRKLWELPLTRLVDTATLHPGAPVLATAGPRNLMLIDVEKGCLLAEGPMPDDRIDNLAFSPDGQELAVRYNAGGPTGLRIYDRRGRIVFDTVVPQLGAGRSPHREAVQWLPNGKGLLVSFDYFVDRATGLLVWRPQALLRSQKRVLVLNDDHVLMIHADGGVALRTRKIPHGAVARALAAAKQRQGRLTPGMGVALDVAVDNVRFENKSQIAARLSRVLTQRLERSGLTVGPGGDLSLRVDYTEAAGSGTNIVAGPGRGRVIGRTRQTAIECKLSLRAADGTVLWSATKTHKPASYGMVSSTGEKDLRNSAVSGMLTELARLDLPYFIPKDTSLPTLPVVGASE